MPLREFLRSWRREPDGRPGEDPVERLARKYRCCREVITHNNEALDLLSRVQEDLRYAPPRADVAGETIAAVFREVASTVASLECLTGRTQAALRSVLARQQREVEQSLAARQEAPTGRLAVRLSEVGGRDAGEIGAKAAALAEVARLDIPVPMGYVMTTAAYEQFWVLREWRTVRDLTKDLEVSDAGAVSRAARQLRGRLLGLSLPRAVEVALTQRAARLDTGGLGLSVRSSAVGEGEVRSFAGQFRSDINVPIDQIGVAYKAVLASRFSPRALAYRLSLGLSEVASPLAVLVLPTLRARAAGVLYTRDPQAPREERLWVTARWGLGLDVTQGHPADWFVVSRRGGYRVIERRVEMKAEELVPRGGGGLIRRAVHPGLVAEPALGDAHLRQLAEWSLRIERHFGAPQDIEWLLDQEGDLWVLQARPLAQVTPSAVKSRPVPAGDAVSATGRTVFPGRASGPAFPAASPRELAGAPEGSILFVRRASPEIVQAFPRIAGLVADWGNVTGHAATLLREFGIPSVFDARGAFDAVSQGDVVSLDAGAAHVVRGRAWPAGTDRVLPAAVPAASSPEGVVGRRLLALNLVDPAAWSFRPSRCQSAHDVLRFCHERAIGEMFALSDRELRQGTRRERRLVCDAPINVHVLDLGGGVSAGVSRGEVRPGEVLSRPFEALWRGAGDPRVTWNRNLPASLGGLASVMGQAFSATQPSSRRPVGAKSYLMVTGDYMNLNARLAFHFTLVDAVVTDTAAENAIAFRFAGGAATRQRRDLRACFIEACLSHYGFAVDRRGDLVNAWFKKAPASDTEARLEMVGRLIACSSQLDMYMTDAAVMRWYVRQFLTGNYGFRPEGAP